MARRGQILKRQYGFLVRVLAGSKPQAGKYQKGSLEIG